MWSATLKAKIAKIKLAPKHRRLWLGCGLLLVMVVLVVWWSQSSGDRQSAGRLNGYRLQLEVADTEQARRQGLSGRSSLAHEQGMLFVFDKPGNYCFWMKDMRFAIDLVWLDTNRRIVGFERHMTPASYPRNFCPQVAVHYVLELPAGSISDLRLSTGMQLDL